MGRVEDVAPTVKHNIELLIIYVIIFCMLRMIKNEIKFAQLFKKRNW